MHAQNSVSRRREQGASGVTVDSVLTRSHLLLTSLPSPLMLSLGEGHLTSRGSVRLAIAVSFKRALYLLWLTLSYVIG